MTNIIYQSIGYLATVFLGISLMTKNSIRFRWINGAGCLAFVIYGFLIGALPVVITNLLLVVINFYYLIKLYKTEDTFDLIEYKPDEQMVQKFISFYAEDIKEYFPDYIPSGEPNRVRFIILRNLVIANIFVAEIKEGVVAEVLLNFTIPQFRDNKVGKFLLNSKKDYLLEKGIHDLHYEKVTHKGHAKFLRVIGFIRKGKEYSKSLLSTES
jgi:hypothetical protein